MLGVERGSAMKSVYITRRDSWGCVRFLCSAAHDAIHLVETGAVGLRSAVVVEASGVRLLRRFRPRTSPNTQVSLLASPIRGKAALPRRSTPKEGPVVCSYSRLQLGACHLAGDPESEVSRRTGFPGGPCLR